MQADMTGRAARHRRADGEMGLLLMLAGIGIAMVYAGLDGVDTAVILGGVLIAAQAVRRRGLDEHSLGVGLLLVAIGVGRELDRTRHTGDAGFLLTIGCGFLAAWLITSLARARPRTGPQLVLGLVFVALGISHLAQGTPVALLVAAGLVIVGASVVFRAGLGLRRS